MERLKQLNTVSATCLHAVTFAHLQHLATTSDAEHRALSSFYQELGYMTDKLIEQAIGAFGMDAYPVGSPQDHADLVSELARKLTEDGNFGVVLSVKSAVLDFLTIFEAGLDPAIASVLQDILGLCHQTVYKLDRLS